MAYTFDGVNKRIVISAQTTMSVRDVYARWADWYATADNSKYLPAFSTLGGDDIDPGAGTTVPIYAFLVNGWRIRPQESNHTLTVNDGILLVQGGGDPFLNTLGSFVVRINYQQPVQAITVSTGGGGGATPAQIWQHVIESTFTAEQVMRLLASLAAGQTIGHATGPAFKSLDGTKNRITADVDEFGNRSNVQIDAS
ncbi:MAG: hypothetical protein ACRCWJ_19255 [Casimicrobium sp.]